jgi:ankyrin repeat protein
VKRPSATKLGTYLHAFLSLAKKGKDDEIISVIRAMVEVSPPSLTELTGTCLIEILQAGIDVQELNSFYQTPLHIAVAFSTPAVVRALIVDNSTSYRLKDKHASGENLPFSQRSRINRKYL